VDGETLQVYDPSGWHRWRFPPLLGAATIDNFGMRVKPAAIAAAGRLGCGTILAVLMGTGTPL
jgi:hypothetical protein